MRARKDWVFFIKELVLVALASSLQLRVALSRREWANRNGASLKSFTALFIVCFRKRSRELKDLTGVLFSSWKLTLMNGMLCQW